MRCPIRCILTGLLLQFFLLFQHAYATVNNSQSQNQYELSSNELYDAATMNMREADGSVDLDGTYQMADQTQTSIYNFASESMSDVANESTYDLANATTNPLVTRVSVCCTCMRVFSLNALKVYGELYRGMCLLLM